MTENIDPETILRNLSSGFFISQKITALGAVISYFSPLYDFFKCSLCNLKQMERVFPLDFEEISVSSATKSIRSSLMRFLIV